MSSSTFGILAAMLLFAVGLGTPIVLLGQMPTQDLDDASLQHDARESLGRFVRPPLSAWEGAPEAAEDYALLVGARDHALDEDRVVALGKAPYPRVRDTMGIPRDFHIEMRPLLASMDDPQWEPLALESVAYLGGQAPLKLPVVFSSAVVATSRHVNLSATITNAGTQPAIFEAEFSLGNSLEDALLLTQTRNTRLLAPNETQTIWASYGAVPSWDPKITGARVELGDAFGGTPVARDGASILPKWHKVTLPVSAITDHSHLLRASQTYFDGTQKVTFLLDHFGALGVHTAGATGVFTLHGPNGAEWINRSISLPAAPGAVYTIECANCTADGVYTARLWDRALTHAQTAVAYYSSLALFTQLIDLHPTGLREAAQMDELVAGFDATLYHAVATPRGDVYTDRAKGSREITQNLGRYATLVVGSDVSNSALASSGARTALNDWVRGGGTLVVLGSSKGPIEWPNPLWGIALKSEDAPSVVTGERVRTLAEPEPLDAARFKTWGRAWSFANASAFERIVAPADPSRAVWATSLPDAFGEGTVVFTAYTPGDATAGPTSATEGKRLLHNVLVHAHTRLYASFGAEVPDDRPVAAAHALVLGRDRLAPDGHPVRVVVRVFE